MFLGFHFPYQFSFPCNIGYDEKLNLTRMLAASVLGFATAANFHRRRTTKTTRDDDARIIPWLERTESGRVGKLERFSHYVARQLGFSDPSYECPQLCKLAYDYLRKSKDCENNVYEFFADQADGESLYVKLIDEFDKCILSYFAFHWTQVSQMITQVMNDESEKKPKLKDLVMAATRQQRFERVNKNLKMTRVFSTLVEEMKAIGKGDSQSSDIMVPVALCDRSPVLLLMGGGMGAGKSTVINDILKESFWSGSAPLIVEADAFKESDVIYRAISAMGHHDDMLQTAELVHQSSTDAASSLLVTALNEGRDVILDGTLSWVPYVEQTIAMARNVHKYRYRMGAGYKVDQEGNVTEEYWEKEEVKFEQQLGENGEVKQRKPYRIEMVGVVCDAYLAVVRGIRRAIMTKRAVRVGSQLQSHKRFANAFTGYCQLVDNARLYCTNAVGGPHRLIAWKDGDSNLLIDPEEFKCLKNVASLNSEAESIHELYVDPSPVYNSGSVWKDIVISPSRSSIQSELKFSITNVESSIKGAQWFHK